MLTYLQCTSENNFLIDLSLSHLVRCNKGIMKWSFQKYAAKTVTAEMVVV